MQRAEHAARRQRRHTAPLRGFVGAFLLRIDPSVLEALQRWADDELRSLNGQIEFVLRRALAEAQS